MRRAFLLLAKLGLLLGCSSAPIKLDTTLIRPFSYEQDKQEPFPPPFISIYKKHDRTLIFVSAFHSHGPKNATFSTIDYVFQKYRPKGVIVEGRPFTTISNPEDLIEVKDCEIKKFLECAENKYTLYKAASDRIAFSYGEPTDEEIRIYLLKKGYSDSDIILFYGARQIPQWRREGVKHRLDFKKKLNSALEISTPTLKAKAQRG